MSWMQEDRRLILAAADELEDYLLSAQLFWRLVNKAGTLKPGNLMLALRRKGVNEAILSKKCEYLAAEEKIIGVQEKWRSAWEKKVVEEIGARVRLWKNSLDEIAEEGIIDQTTNTAIKHRVILEILTTEVRAVSIVDSLDIHKMDEQLQSLVNTGNFLWETELSSVFDKKTYWFLYLKKGEVNSVRFLHKNWR